MTSIDDRKAQKIIDILAEDAPSFISFPDGEYFEQDVASLKQHLLSSDRTEWSNRGVNLRLIVQSTRADGKEYRELPILVPVVNGRGGKYTTEEVSTVNERFKKELY